MPDAGGMRFGEQIRHWRRQRRRSQLDLALHSGFSQRHISFLESGRAQPSRASAVVLAEALEIPLEARNDLLQAAGFAPLYSAETLDSALLEPAMAALATVMDSHRPFPALLLDRAWNILGGNDNAFALLQGFSARALPAPTGQPLNALRLCLDAGALRESIVDWPAFMVQVVQRLREQWLRSRDEALAALLQAVEADPEYPARDHSHALAFACPVATMTLARGTTRVSLYSLHSSFATPMDTTLAQLRIETFFPADTASREALLAIDAGLAPAQQG